MKKSYKLQNQPITEANDDHSWSAINAINDVNDDRTDNFNYIQNQATSDDDAERMSQIVGNLISKNKINSKNAFQVPILNINNLRSYAKEDDGSWSKISSTLENSSKVYGFRVDWMSESISKITNSMARSLNIQYLENQQQQKEKKKSNIVSNQLKIPRIIKLQQAYYDQKQLNLHLEQSRLNQQSNSISYRNFESNLKIRRLMDQNGISKLILATVPLCENLQISILNPVSSQVWRMKPLQNMTIMLPKFSCNETIQMNISKQIRQMHRKTQNNNIPAQISEHYQHQLDNLIKQDNFIAQLESNHIQLQDLNQQIQQEVNDNRQQGYTHYYLQDELDIPNSINDILIEKKLRVNNKLISKQKKQLPKKRGNNKNLSKTKGKKGQLSQMLYDFSINHHSQLQKKNILKVRRSYETKDKSLKKLNKNFNMYQSIFSAFQVQHEDYLAANQVKISPLLNLLINQHNQYNLRTDGHAQNKLKQYEEQMEHNVQFDQFGGFDQKQNEQQILKCPQIRQNKQQLAEIISEVQSRISFSNLHRIHKHSSELTTEAIDFLSVLHLGNQLGLIFQQINACDFFIIK